MPDYQTLFARVVSIVFHPLLVPFYAFLLLLGFTGYSQLQIPARAVWPTAAIVLTLTALIPSLIFYVMLRMKMISSLEMPFRRERNVPILITALFFYITYHLLNKIGIAPLFSFYMLAASMLSLLALGVNMWLKISLHMVALGALAGSFSVFARIIDVYFLNMALITVLFAGVIATSRLLLRAHQPKEIYFGFILGFGWMYFLFALVP